MNEKHNNEQYFFNESMIFKLSDFVGSFEKPCCLCTPSVSKELEVRGKSVKTLDIDTRFSFLKEFVYFDLKEAPYVQEEFDLILCDPPFFNISLSQLNKTISQLAHFNYETSLLITYLTRRANSFLSTFKDFKLRELPLLASYNTVQKVEKNEISFFSNISDIELKKKGLLN